MSLIERLNSEGDLFSLRYYGKEDMITPHHLNKILKNKEVILDYYEKDFDFEIKTVSNFIDYLFLNFILKFKELEEDLKEEFKEEFKLYLEKLERISNKVKPKNLIEFLRNNFENVFFKYDDKILKYDLKRNFLKIYLKYNTGLGESNILSQILEHEFIMAYDHLEKFQKILKTENLLDGFFLDENNLNKILEHRSENFFEFILPKLNANLKNKILDQLYEIYTIKIQDFLIEKKFKTGLGISMNLNLLYPIFYKSKHPLTEKLLENKIELEKSLKYENLKSYKIEISSKKYQEYIEELEKQEIPLELQFLTISHYLKNKKILRLSQLEHISRNYEKRIIDFVSTNIQTDDFFLAGKIQQIDIFLLEKAINLSCWLTEEKMTYFLKSLSGIINEIYNKLSINILEEELEIDIRALEQCIKDCVISAKKNDYNFFTGSFFIMALLEKITRNIYTQIDNDGFFRSESATYVTILKNDKMSELIGNDSIKWIRYYMIGEDSTREGKDKMGESYRNKIAHFTRIKIGEIKEIHVLKILWIFLNTLNSIWVSLISSEESNTQKD